MVSRNGKEEKGRVPLCVPPSLHVAIVVYPPHPFNERTAQYIVQPEYLIKHNHYTHPVLGISPLVFSWLCLQRRRARRVHIRAVYDIVMQPRKAVALMARYYDWVNLSAGNGIVCDFFFLSPHSIWGTRVGVVRIVALLGQSKARGALITNE